MGRAAWDKRRLCCAKHGLSGTGVEQDSEMARHDSRVLAAARPSAVAERFKTWVFLSYKKIKFLGLKYSQ
jgi:hypothetical protein